MKYCIDCGKLLKCKKGKTGKCLSCALKGNKRTLGYKYNIRKRHKPNCSCCCCKKIRHEKITIEHKQNLSKSITKAWKEGRCSGMTGKEHKSETIEQMRKSAIGKVKSVEHRKNLSINRLSNPRSPGYKRGTRIYFDVPSQGKVCLRSSYEFIFARYLVAKQVDFRYEYKRFILDAKTYLPDFYLVNDNKFIEIKGFVRDSDTQIMKEMKIFHPNIKIEMIIGKEIDKYKL